MCSNLTLFIIIFEIYIVYLETLYYNFCYTVTIQPEKETYNMTILYRGRTTFKDEAGNPVEFEVKNIRGSDKGFTKVWLNKFMDKLDIIGNKKLKVAFWLIRHADRNTNQINYSLRQIAEKSGMGLSTVTRTITALQKTDFIRQVGKVYMLNPDVLYKNYSAGARRAALDDYESGTRQGMTPEERKLQLSKEMASISTEKEDLQTKLDERRLEYDSIETSYPPDLNQ